MRKILLPLASLFIMVNAYAQCDSAIATGLTLQCSGGTSNRSAVAYNPIFQVYYSADAGSPSYPFETFNSAGVMDTSITANIDWRGLWWNPNSGSAEGTDIGGTTIDSLVINPANGYSKTGVTTTFTYSTYMGQSCGSYDPDSNEIIFYNGSGSICRFSRATGALKYTTPITGAPTANLNAEFIGYTGTPGAEYLVYDYSAQAIYFLNRSGAYVKQALLPPTAVSNSGFRASYCNGFFWLFDGSNKIWTAYQLSSSTAAMLNQAGCDSLVSPSGKYVWKATGTYMDTIPNVHGCDSIMTVNVTINSKPTITITGRDTITSGSVDTLTASGGASYAWTTGSLSDTTMVKPTTTQTYTVNAVDSNGCTNNATFTVVVNGASAVNEVKNSTATLLYPNPVANTLNLEFKTDANTNGKLELYDAAGRMISTSELALVNGKTIHMDVTGLVQGVYFVKIVTGKNTQVLQFIKQ